MSNVTTKKLSEKDFGQVLRAAFNDADDTISTAGFLDGKIGHKTTTTNVSSIMDDYRMFDIVETTTATLTSTSAVVTGLADTTNMKVGQYLFLTVGTSGIPANTTIVSIDSNTQLTMSAAATASGSFTFRTGNLLKRLRLLYNNASHDVLVDAERVE